MNKKYKQGDIVLIEFPYSDKPKTKKRPAIIISNDFINQYDFIVARITSVIKGTNLEFPIENDFIDFILNYKSVITTNTIVTIHHTKVIKKLGSFKNEPFESLLTKIKENISVPK